MIFAKWRYIILLGAILFAFGVLYADAEAPLLPSITAVLAKLNTYFKDLDDISTKLKVKEIKKRNLKSLSKDVTEKLTSLFDERLSSLLEVAEYAEDLYKNYTVNDDLDDTYEYFGADGDASNELEEFSPNPNIKVNLNLSCVQTPKDVYQFASKILNSIEWTKGLDAKFKENLENTKTKFKAWQYIGLSDGVFRTYPGSFWQTEDLTYFDVRQRSWYIQGSSPPKDMVIVIDLSGSVIGSRLLIIKLAVISMIDTLQPDDFVNIIYFNEKAHYLQTLENHNWTNLVQATSGNKKILKDALKGDLKPGKDTAKVEAGFKMAFEILEKSRRSLTTTSNCSQTIAFFTDGVEGETVADDVFNEYNSDKQIRVFTYLVGREKGASFEAVKWVACKNKGYFYRVETLSDVREKIVKYVNVLSRSTSGGPKWTPLYLDALGLGLLSALVVPIFDTKTKSKGEQLGVVGADLLLDEIQSKISEYKLGTGGYAFSITNNGLIFFHPFLKKEESINLDYSSNVYLSEVEQYLENKDVIKQLSELMIDRQTEGLSEESKNYIVARYNDKFRVAHKNLTYMVDYITNTSFSVALAMADYGSFYIVRDGKKTNSDINTNNFSVTVAKWPYCNEVIESFQELKDEIHQDKKCVDEELMNNAKYDLEDLIQWEPVLEGNITRVFFGTASGLTFVVPKGENADFKTSIKEEYYERAAQHWLEKIVVFSALSDTQVRASKAVVVKKDDKKAIWGVAGIDMNYVELKQTFQAIDECTSNKENVCYFVDEHGYILAASNEGTRKRTGEFFGKVEGTVMKDLIHKGAFKKFNFTDVEATCQAGYDEETSSSIRILDPFFAFGNYVKWWTNTMALALLQYSLYAAFSERNQVKAEEKEQTVRCRKIMGLYIRPDLLRSFDNDELTYDGCKKSYNTRLIDGTNLMLVIVTHENSTYCQWRNEKIKDDPTPVVLEPSSEQRYRQEPFKFDGCYPKREEPGKCSSGEIALPSLLFLVVIQIIFYLNGGFAHS